LNALKLRSRNLFQVNHLNSLQKATFSDAKTDAYFDASNPLGGVYVAGHGVTVTVTSQNTGGTMGVTVNNPAE